MKFEWDNKIGPASIVGVIGIIATLLGVGAMYGTMQSNLSATAEKTSEVHAAVKELKSESAVRDQRVSKVETAIEFVRDTVNRIDARLAKP
jgi:septal ring factor EnvC (AmiA/AmiB activator)